MIVKVLLKKTVVIAFHSIYNDSNFNKLKAKTSLGMSSRKFEKIMKWLNRYYKFLSFDEYISGKEGVLITFDDGYANNLSEALPILSKYSAPAIVFVSCDHINDKQNHSRMRSAIYPLYDKDEIEVYNHYFDGLTEAQLLELHQSSLIEIGNHTYYHSDLSRLNEDQIILDIKKANDFLLKKIGISPRLFAYPFASYSKKVVKVLESLGFKYAFLLENGNMDDKQLQIRRLGIYKSNKLYLAAKLSKFYDAKSKS
jgi:peptidoglycan/xylan/chitin deacetylase (PgdA/CDA1 family)